MEVGTVLSLAGAWAELGNKKSVDIYNELFFIVHTYFLTSLLRTPLCFSKIDRTRDIRHFNQKSINSGDGKDD